MRKKYIAIIMLLCAALFAGCQETVNSGILRNEEEETPSSIVDSNVESPELILESTPEDTSTLEINDVPVPQDILKDEVTLTQELEELMTTFGQAYFNGDIDAIEGLLIDDYEWEIEVYESPDQVYEIEIMQIKGLQQIDENQLLDQYELSIEFRIPGEDSLTYLSVTWENVEGDWKVSGYGLEK